MDPRSLKGGSFGEQRSLSQVGGFVLSETRHRRGQDLPRHTHERASINFVLAGVYAETFRGASHTYGAGSLVVKPAGEAHANHFRDASARCLLIELASPQHPAIQDYVNSPAAPAARPAPDLAPIAARIMRELRRPDRYSELAVEGYILELLVASARTQDQHDAGVVPSWLRRIVERLHEDPSELRLTDLAYEAGVHPAHLTRAFRKYFGTPPGAYARRLRLQRAIELLTGSSEPIGAIALQAGFFDQSHFTRSVKRETGLTPRELRAALGG